MDYVYSIKMSNGMRGEAVGDGALQLRMGDYCIIRKEYTLEYVLILMQRPGGADPEKTRDLPRIQRVATMYDRGVATENEARAKSAYRTACQMVEDMKLPMKLLNASFSFDQKLVTILFTADGRVDFRELVKELSRALGTRLELRQIGVRDETGICGGIAVCGQVLCCTRFLREFSSINVRMAKDQDLSLTPATISGVCGRLKCCLKYEHDGYVEMEKSMPRRGELCECAKGRGRVADRNMLTRRVTLALEDGGSVTLSADELQYRNRSARKPEDRNGAAEVEPQLPAAEPAVSAAAEAPLELPARPETPHELPERPDLPDWNLSPEAVAAEGDAAAEPESLAEDKSSRPFRRDNNRRRGKNRKHDRRSRRNRGDRRNGRFDEDDE